MGEFLGGFSVTLIVALTLAVSTRVRRWLRGLHASDPDRPRRAVIPVWGVCGGLCALVVVSMFGVVFDEVSGRSRFAHREVAAAEASRWVASGLHRDLAACVRRLGRRGWTSAVAVELARLLADRPDLKRALIGDPKAHRALRRWVERGVASRDSERRARAVETAGALGLASTLPLVRLAAIDPEPTTRVAACVALFALHDPHASTVLLRLIEQDGSWALALLESDVARADGLVSRRRMDNWGATPALAGLSGLAPEATTPIDPDDDPDDDLTGLLVASGENSRCAALGALTASGLVDRWGLVRDLLDDGSEAVRLAAVQAVGRLLEHTPDRSDIRVALVPSLGDLSNVIRSTAAAVLLTSPDGRAALTVIRLSPDAVVAECAQTALWRAPPAAAIAPVGLPV